MKAKPAEETEEGKEARIKTLTTVCKSVVVCANDRGFAKVRAEGNSSFLTRLAEQDQHKSLSNCTTSEKGQAMTAHLMKELLSGDKDRQKTTLKLHDADAEACDPDNPETPANVHSTEGATELNKTICNNSPDGALHSIPRDLQLIEGQNQCSYLL